MRMHALSFWHQVRRHVLGLPAGTVVRYAKPAVPHPRDAGAQLSLGWPVGQVADYRFDPEHDCSGMHVHEFAAYWEVHIDRVHPRCGLIEHARADKPEALLWGGAILGGLIGGAVGGRRDSALAGAALGLIAAAFIHRGAPAPLE